MSVKEVKVSIIIPVYNKEKYIQKCIESILNQTYKNFELILVDDGSADKSGMICKQYGERDSRIRYVYQTNKGLISARKCGLEQANTEYVLFVDADDWIEEDFVETLVTPLIEESVGYDFITSGLVFEDENSTFVEENGTKAGVYEEKDIHIIRKNFLYDEEYQRPSMVHSMCGKVLKRDKLKKVYDSIDTSLTIGEDGITLFRYLCQIDSVVVLKYAGYHYVQYEDSMMHSFDEEDVWRLMLLKDAYSKIAKQIGIYEDIKHYIARHIYTNYLIAVGRSMEIEYNTYFIIPRFLYESNVKVVIYGAGKKGIQFQKQINNISTVECVGWVDRNYMNLPDELNVSPVENILNLTFDYILIAIENNYIVHDVIKNLMDMGVPYEKIWSLEKRCDFIKTN